MSRTSTRYRQVRRALCRYERAGPQQQTPRSFPFTETVLRSPAVVGIPSALESGRSRAETGLRRMGPQRGTSSAAGEDDELPGRSGHRDIAVDGSFDARAEALRIDESPSGNRLRVKVAVDR